MSMCTTLEVTSSHLHNDSKHYNMKQFISILRGYLQTKTEDAGNLINRHLQLLSVAIDLSIFDPHTNVVSEFFVSLYQLLTNLEQRSPLAWCCVNVLSVACRNAAARKALIHTYQFLPLLSRLLGDQLNVEKKIRLLSLMQELTCGIQISWQIPHLPHLMSTLTRWIEIEEEEIVTLSLGVLVNLCYKNLPAVYTLSRCVDIKKLVRICMPLKGLKIEVHVCKLLIILDYMNGKVPEGAFLKLVEVTFKSVVEAFKAKDSVLLRHVVEFFLDMWKQNNHTAVLLNFDNYDQEVNKLLLVVEELAQKGSGEIVYDSECMGLLLEFLHFLLELNLPKLVPLHSRLVNICLMWIKTDLVCPEALAILRYVAVNTSENKGTILEPFLIGLPVFLVAIENGKEEIPTHIENNKRLSALMELLRALVKADGIRDRVLGVLKQELLSKIFIPLLGDRSLAISRPSDTNTFSLEATILYVNTIALIDELAKYETKWIELYKSLMEQKQIYMVLAQGLYRGPKEIKALIMSMSFTSIFPTNEVASVMCDLQPFIQTDPGIGSNSSQQIVDSLCFPVMSVTQIERLNEIMDKLKQACEESNLNNVSTSDVMELYEYKLATMNHAERAAIASVEAASLRCTHLQHRTAQLSAELSRLHQLLLYSQQSNEEAIKIKNAVIEKNKQLQEWLDSEKSRCASQLSIKDKLLTEKIQSLEDTSRRLKDTENEKNIIEEKQNELKKVVTKLENNLVKKEKLIEKKEEQLAKSSMSNEHLKMQVTQLEKQIKHVEAELAIKSKDLACTSEDLRNCKQILGTITQLTHSQYVK